MSKIGERLRRRRQAAGLTLHDVERRTRGEFKASALGAYERGERALSVERMFRLAQVLGADVEELVGSVPDIDLPAMHAADVPPRAVEADDPVRRSLARFAAHIRSRRRPPLREPLRVRRSDYELLAIILDTDPATVEQQLVLSGPRETTYLAFAPPLSRPRF
jgi:transcriptional regulator with XRE-family HTH domain